MLKKMNRKGKHKNKASYAFLLFFLICSVSALSQRKFSDIWEERQYPTATFTQQPKVVFVKPDSMVFKVKLDKPFHTHANEDPNFSIEKEQLNAQKRKLHSQAYSHKRNPDSLQIASSFEANPVQNYSPMDNHLAIGKQGILVSVVNSNMAIYDTSGNRLQFSTFKQLAGDPSLTNEIFDPRVVYDALSDRFVMMILHGTNSTSSKLLIFASRTSNPLDGWHHLSISGNINNSNFWTDFPHLAVAKDHIFISANAFQNISGSSQFDESVVWTLDKQSLYQGQNTMIRLIQDLRTIKNRQAFAAYPMMNPLEAWNESGMFFLSSISSGGDALDLLYIQPTGKAYFRRIPCLKYEAPADVFQERSSEMLDAGDNRISGGFILNELIHFTMNIRGGNLLAEIRYGRIDLKSDVLAERKVFTAEEAAYASIAPISGNKSNGAVLIHYLAAGTSSFASMRYAYMDAQMDQYPGGKIIDGQHAINKLQTNTERWGDYTAAVLEPGTNPPSVWLAGSIVNAQGNWENHVARFTAKFDSTGFKPAIIQVKSYPNPFKNQLQVEVGLERNSSVQIVLYSSEGKQVKMLLDENLSRGINRYTFTGLPFSQGLYYLRVLVNGVSKYEEPVIVKE